MPRVQDDMPQRVATAVCQRRERLKLGSMGLHVDRHGGDNVAVIGGEIVDAACNAEFRGPKNS